MKLKLNIIAVLKTDRRKTFVENTFQFDEYLKKQIENNV
jgi:hypothetical protein